MYHLFKNRITLSATLKAETALYIGAGQKNFTPMAVQGSLLKNQRNEPYIPGSSLKGVLRSFLESVQGEEEKAKCVSCTKDKEKSLSDKTARFNKIQELKAETGREDGDALLAEYITANSCPACRLFGSGIMAGKLKFADATLLHPEAWMGTELRTGNAIDRDTHTVVTSTGALFDTEVIPSGTEFSLRIVAENLTQEEAAMFSELLEYFAQGGITVGGRSRAGLGMVSLKEIEVEVSYMEKGCFAPKLKKIEDIYKEDKEKKDKKLDIKKPLLAFLQEQEVIYV